jgi:hypothetical protein
LEEPKSPPPTGFPQYNSNDLPFFGPESRSSSAYGHLGFFRNLDELPEASHQQKITIKDGVLLIDKSPFFLQPGLQSRLVEDFWTWQNTWPLLIHEPLFRKDLSDNCAGGYCTPTLLASLLALSAHNTDDSQLGHPHFDWNASRDSLVQHAKSSVLEKIEYPSLSLVLSAAFISQIELLMENIGSASQYIGK